MSSYLSNDFFQSAQEITGKALDRLRQDYFIEAQMRGIDDASIGGQRINTSGRQNSADHEEQKRKQSLDDVMFLSLLDDMRQRLDELEESMARRYKTLEQKYGEDVIGGMVDTFLSDEEKAGLKTDQQKMEALSKKFLNPDGSIKDEYKDLEEAKYIRDWQEAQKLKPIVQKYEGRNDLTAAEKQEVLEAAEVASLSDNKNKIALSSNDEYKTTVDQKIDESRGDLNSVRTGASVTFGA